MEEDVVIDYKKQFKLERHGADKKYTYTFENHGKYAISLSIYPTIEIPVHKEKNISALAINRLLTQFCTNGERFYLLICKDGRKMKIIQIFNKRHFAIQKGCFDYIDGKYFCKKI